MPYPFQLKRPNFSHVLSQIENAVFKTLAPLEVTAFVTPEPVPYAERKTGRQLELVPGDPWGELFDCAWMHVTGTVPAEAAGKNAVLLLDVSGEAFVADESGEPVLGLTSKSSGFDFSLGKPTKRVVPLRSPAAGGEAVDLWLDAGSNDLFGTLQNQGTLAQAEIAEYDPEMSALLYDAEVLIDALGVLPAKSARAQRIAEALYEASAHLRDYTSEEARAARAVLAPALKKRGGDPSLTISAVGHAHIDLAWLWPIRESIRKTARTFSTVLSLMDRYPDYVFGASQPQQYQWMKEQYPSLYARIKARVAEGRWEVQGAMWVEPDTNLTGGESLIRQMLYGKRFFQDEFGVTVDNLWEPDVFGYSGALPQLLVKSGLKYFMTQKMSWNEINKFPHQTFWWQGIDGSRILSHMLPEETYNGPALPRSVHKAETNYFDAPVSENCLMLFGIGDGGGGPGPEHLERLSRLENFEGLCPVVQETAAKFFERLAQNADKYVVWRGELYLEKHQGTLTTQGRSKRFNRKIEYLLREVELSAVWAVSADAGYAYPKDALDRLWKEVLLLQFHDILPGSSITRVYTESLVRYAAIEAELKQLLSDADAAWTGKTGVGETGAGEMVAVNSLSWTRREWVKSGDDWRFLTLPALSRTALPAETPGYRTPSASKTALENDLLVVTLSPDGGILSVYDKEAGREAITAGAVANRLHLYADDGDAWDFAIDFQQRPPDTLTLQSAEAFSDGPEAVVRCVYHTPGGKSVVRQDIVLTAGSRRLDFRTSVDWNESSRMLRAEFPVAVASNTVLCDIQFGTISRPTTSNTTWDAAVHEIAAHKWIDVSEPGGGYGVALLNDCKYGHRAKDGVLSLNLLRSPHYPDPVADVPAHHEFTYALYPHPGTAVSAQIMQRGYEMNIPIRAVPGQASASPEPWLTIDAPNIIAETIKRSEDGQSVIVRLYESAGARATANVEFGFPVRAAALVNLMEDDPQPLSLGRQSVAVGFGPFEIHTLRVTL